jgi:hypothetical protein
MRRAVAFAGTLLLAGASLAQEAPSPTEDVKLPPEKNPAEEVIQKRPGQSEPLRYVPPPADPSQVPPPQAAQPRETLPVPDRWRIMQGLGYDHPWYDPYNQNTLKGDLPISKGSDWFLNLGAVSDTLLEARRLPTPVPPQASTRAGSNDAFGQGKQSTFSETLIVSASLIKGDTTFRPPDLELRFTPAFNFNRSMAQENRVLFADPSKGDTRDDSFAAVQEAFADVHLRNVSERYDFDSLRVGIQPFTSDFRGFVFQDVPFGVRLFGTRDNNRWQYNLGWFRRIEKDTNSGLNDVGKGLRDDDTFVANAYRQDFPALGFTSQATVMVNRNNEGSTGQYFDNNGFLVRPAQVGDERPHNYRVTYLGYNGDGHFGRTNLSVSIYGAFGHDDHNPIAGQPQDIVAGFAAAELSRDYSWVRLRLNALFQSGDKNPFDGKATGFDAILENPQFAGAGTSFWIRQAIPLVGGGGVTLSGRNGVLASLRSSKDEGQSNFVNPGLVLLGGGADFDLTPQWRLISNISYLQFQSTEVLAALRSQSPPPRSIGWDLSAGVQWRPFMSQNMVLNASAAALLPAEGLKQLYDTSQSGALYSILVNLLVSF